MWITKDIKYKEAKVYKERRFLPKSIKNGYELLEPLEYIYKDEILHLPVGYVWDGSSYPRFIEWLVGRRNKESLLAASAMHDTLTYKIKALVEDGYIYRTFSINEAAWMYKKMIADWPNKEVIKRKRVLQWLGLIIFQRLGRITSPEQPWKKYEG